MVGGLPQSVGLFGLGLIGHSIAVRILAAGVAVRGFDPDPVCMDQLAAIGGTPMTADQIWDANLVVSAVFSTDQLSDLIDMAPDSNSMQLISVSTCDPDLMADIGVKASQKGIDLIEAPISGTSADLASGEAIMLAAGDPAIIDDLAPVFNALVRAHYKVGALGNGNRAKLAINLILGLSRAALAEGIVFAKAVGIDPNEFLALAQDSAASSKVMASKGPKMVARDFSPLGRITQSAKDFALINEIAIKSGQGLPMAQRYLEIVDQNIAMGEGDLDNSAVLLAIERTPIPTDEKI